ncbi:MAG: hypothetical protein ABFD92_03815 [Planctomycetaceae bacterium]|nr:PcfJ domain-containing protein [Planctomycetaceae bacterium]
MDSRLYRYTFKDMTVVNAWPKPAAWYRRTGSDRWYPCKPSMDLWPKVYQPFLPGIEEDLCSPDRRMSDCEAAYAQQMRAENDYAKTIPMEVRQVVGLFRCCQWNVLRMIARCPATIDFVRRNPILGFCLAASRSFSGHREPSACRLAQLAGLKQRHLLQWLGFPGTEAAARVIRKIAPQAAAICTLKALKVAMGDSNVLKMLSHAPAPIRAEGLAVVLNPRTRQLVSPSLISDLWANPEEPMPEGHFSIENHDLVIPTECVGSLSELAELSSLVRPGRHPPRVRSIEDINRWYGKLSMEAARGEDAAQSGIRFPPPPIQGMAFILPLMTPKDLIEEGQRQRNCVAQYIADVAMGRRYIYRVLAPERATVSVFPIEGAWAIENVEAANSQPVEEITRQFVAEWISDSRG